MKRVALIACGAKNRDDGFRHPAKQLYTGSFFRMSARWAEAVADEWAILSAKHGLLRPDDTVVAYEQSLMSMSADERDRWADRVVDQVTAIWDPASTVFVSSAGTLYRRVLDRFPHTELLVDRIPEGSPRGLGFQLQ